jgi:Winged helix-turn helix
MAFECAGGAMAEPVRARRLTDQEGQRLQQIVRRGKHESIRVRRAMIIMASASGTPVTAIARLVAADQDTVRDVIHLVNQKGLAALDPRWAGGRPRLISDDDVDFIARRPPLARRSWACRSPAGACAISPATWRATRPVSWPSGGSGCGRSCTPGRSPSSGPGPGRSPPIRTRTPSWTGSST